jgi:hypothetical protein
MTRHYEVTLFDLDKEIADLLVQWFSGHDVGTAIVLPVRLGPTGGMYRDSHLTAVKELRTEGVLIDFLHPSDQRRALSEYSEDVIFAFAIGIAQNITWDAAKAVWRYVRAQALSRAQEPRDPVVKLEIARVKRDDLVVEGFSLTAPVSDETAERFIRLLIGEDDEDSQEGRDNGEE